jgi:hypothetical protein
MIGHEVIQLGDQLGEEHVAAAAPLLNGPSKKAGGQARLANASATGVTLLKLRFSRKFATATTPYSARKWRSFNAAPPKAPTT